MPAKPADQAIKVILGPCIDDTDFKSREESIAYNQAGMEVDVILEKHDGTVTTTALTPTTGGDYDWAHTDQGYYELEIPASGGASYNNDTEGSLRVVGYCTGVLPFSSVAYDVVPEKVWNSLVEGSDNLEVDTVAVSGDTTSADNLELMYDGTGYAGGSTKLGVDAVAISGDATAANNLELDYDGTGYAKANSTIGTCTANTDMVGTDSAALASVLGAAVGASISADIAAVKSDSGAILTDTGSTLDTLIKDIPTTAEFNARTLASADYTVVGDTIAGVTLVDTCTTLTGHTAQTGDGYAIVNHADYGNAKLVRSTTPANTLSVDASNRIDVGSWLGTAVTTSSTSTKPEVDAYSISDDATAANNAEAMYDGTGYVGGTIKLTVDATKISGDATAADNLESAYDGTGYTFTNCLMPANISQIAGGASAANNLEKAYDGTGYTYVNCEMPADVIEISGDSTAANNCELFFDGTGYAGGTTKLNVNTYTLQTGLDLTTTMKTSVDTVVDTALANIDLDHLAKTSYGATKPTDGSLLDQIMNKAAGQTFDATTDSLEAFADAGGGPSSAVIADAVWDEARADHTTADTFGEGVVTDSLGTQAKADVAASVVTATPVTYDLDSETSKIITGVSTSHVLRLRVYQDGVLANATSVTLSNETGAFGVKETATGTVVIADGTSVSATSTGIYEYDASDDMSAGTAYTVAWEVVISGHTIHKEQSVSATEVTDERADPGWAETHD